MSSGLAGAPPTAFQSGHLARGQESSRYHWNIGGLRTLCCEIVFRCVRAPTSASGAAMQTPKLVAVELPNSRFVVRVNGPRLGTFETLPESEVTPGPGERQALLERDVTIIRWFIET